MLDFIDKTLEMVFAFGIPVLVGLFGLISAIGFIMLMDNRERAFSCGINVICVVGYFLYWLPKFTSYKVAVDSEMHEIMINNVCASIVLIICVAFARFLKLIKIPYVITFLIYLGFLIFGF